MDDPIIHANAGPCGRCGERTAPRYRNGFGHGASHHCATCRPIMETQRAAERARQNANRTPR